MKVCNIENCQRTATCRGWCDLHYRRWHRHGDCLTVLKRGMKRGRERPSTKFAAISPTMKELYWAAGFLEGEGSFNSANGSSRISADQVNRQPIGVLMGMFGGAAKQYTKRKYPIHRTQPSPCWTWYVSGSRARGIMMTLYALVSDKRKAQIRTALANG